MAFGKVTEEMTYQKSPEETLVDLEKALNKLGKVKKVDQDKLTIQGKARYGLQSVKIQASVSEEGDGSIISFTAKGDDVGGVGAKNGLQRLRETLENVDDLTYEVSKTGLSQADWVYAILGGIGLIVLTIMIIANPESVRDNQTLIVVVVAFYLTWGIRKGIRKVYKRE